VFSRCASFIRLFRLWCVGRPSSQRGHQRRRRPQGWFVFAPPSGSIGLEGLTQHKKAPRLAPALRWRSGALARRA
jgi:hypothetical protein